MSPVKNQRQNVGLEVLVLQCRSREQCATLRLEASNLHKVWLPVFRIWWNLLCKATCKLSRDNTCLTLSRRLSLRFSCTHPHARIQFCTWCPGRLLSMSSRRKGLETDIRISFHCHVIKKFYGNVKSVLSVPVILETLVKMIISGPRSAVRTRRNRNVRKLGQNMKMTTTLRDDDTTGHGRARGLTLEYLVVTGKGYWWVLWKTSFPNTLIDTDRKYRMSCDN